MIDEENDLIDRADNETFFRKNDLWSFLGTDLPKLEVELKMYLATLESILIENKVLTISVRGSL
jgi:hypothetical protein